MSENERWTIGGGYDGAHHAMFVFGGPQLPPCEHIDVVPASRLQEAEAEAERWKEAWRSRGRRINGVGEFLEDGPWEPSKRRIEVEARLQEAEEALRRAYRQLSNMHPAEFSNRAAHNQCCADEALKTLRSALAALGEATGQREEKRSVMGDGGPCMSCGGNDGYGPAPHHKPDCYFASSEDAGAGRQDSVEGPSPSVPAGGSSRAGQRGLDGSGR